MFGYGHWTVISSFFHICLQSRPGAIFLHVLIWINLGISNILEIQGFEYSILKVLKPSLSSGSLLANTLEFRDDAGNEIAFFEKKKKTKCAQSVAMVRRFSLFVTRPDLSLLQGFPSHSLSLSNKVTLPEGRGGAVATLRHNYRGRNSSVGIFLHAGCQLGHVLQSSSSAASISPSSL